jgi:hypothetical protein
MAEIEVVLDKHGKIDVVNEHQPVLYNEFVHWNFKRNDAKIRKVRIAFRRAAYFTIAGKPSKEFTRTLADSDAIYGFPPRNRTIRKHKGVHVFGLKDHYTITTYDKNDKKIGFLDPEIVPIRP